MLDEAGEVLRPAILWNNQHTGSECEQIHRLAGFTAPKITWVRNHEPEGYARIRKTRLPKDFVRFRLTGEYATDKAGGAGIMLFGLHRQDWAPAPEPAQ